MDGNMLHDRGRHLPEGDEVSQPLKGLEQDEEGQPRTGLAGPPVDEGDLRQRRCEAHHLCRGRCGLQAGIGGVADQGHGGCPSQGWFTRPDRAGWFTTNRSLS
jgi:hypothetical protein